MPDTGSSRSRFSWLQRSDEPLIATLVPWLQALLGVLGATLYVFGRLASDSFYGSFGVSSEEVGLTFASLLLPAVVTALLLTFSVAVIAVYFTRVIAVSRRIVGWLSHQWRVVFYIGVLVGAAMFIVATMLPTLLAVATGNLVLVVAAFFANLIGIMLSEDNESPHVYRLWIVASTALVVVGFLSAAVISGRVLAEYARRGENVSVQFGIQVPSLRAHRIQIASTTGIPKGLQDKCLMLLGSNDGVAVLYDYSGKTIWRIPTGNMVVRDGCT